MAALFSNESVFSAYVSLYTPYRVYCKKYLSTFFLYFSHKKEKNLPGRSLPGQIQRSCMLLFYLQNGPYISMTLWIRSSVILFRAATIAAYVFGLCLLSVDGLVTYSSTDSAKYSELFCVA